MTGFPSLQQEPLHHDNKPEIFNTNPKLIIMVVAPKRKMQDELHTLAGYDLLHCQTFLHFERLPSDYIHRVLKAGFFGAAPLTCKEEDVLRAFLGYSLPPSA